jgi:hypothetical protein
MNPGLIRVGRFLAGLVTTCLAGPPLMIVALAARWRRRPIDLGLGPEPLINNLHFVRAARSVGLRAESYCVSPYHVTSQFDRILGDRPPFGLPCPPPRRLWLHIAGFAWSIHRYRVLAISCHGCLLGRIPVLRTLEPAALRLAGVRSIVLPYGSDVQQLDRNPTPRYRDALLTDYPQTADNERIVRRQVRRWSRHADVVVNGCDWIDYIDRADILTPGHFCITTSGSSITPWHAPDRFTPERPLRLLHAPNHAAIKGTEAIMTAVKRLRDEGHPIDIELIQGRPNQEVRAAIDRCDLVVDQLVIGWYAMFAIEGMSAGRAVVCHVRADLASRYRDAGIIGPDDPPLIRSDETRIESVLRDLLADPDRIASLASRGIAYVQAHHSERVGGALFKEAFQRLGLPLPSSTKMEPVHA